MSHSTGLSSVMGSNISGALGSSMNNALQNSMNFNQQAAQQYNAIMAQKAQYNANRQTYEWVWNGHPVTITEFAELAYGDSPQRTMFLLKYSDKKENKNA
jgi:hypothetical protein